ncbi:MAG: M20/M25/M40 family metallo-hydrolase [Caulobacter sp.]|nr:M20/M25/M40 family metallo-hydrolase [Caulobacter sp.]
MGRIIALTAALAGALLLAWTGTRTPAPGASATPIPTAFRTDLAMADIGHIARVPHPVGSAANAAVRDYLVGRMSALGLGPAVQSGMAIRNEAPWILGGQVQNIVGVLPGADRTLPALALMAHYDSVPASPGAADDATGSAVTLDVIRALKARGTPARDVIVILTDGEEAGLLGAELFFAEHPLRERIGLLINLESRGGGGRANMFQTGPGNGALIPLFANTAVSPISNSLAVFLYENMPNDTDFTVSKDAGVRGLNFAFIGRQFDYHSPSSTPANLDQGSVRHMGDQALAATAALAFAETLPEAAPEAVYSQTFGDHILAYPAWGGWIAWLIAAALIGVATVRTRDDETFRWMDAARGAGAALFLLVAGALLLHLARRATGVDFGFMGQRPLLARWGLWETTLVALGLGALFLTPALLSRDRVRLWLVGAGLFGGLLCLAFAGWDPVGLGLGLATAGLGYIVFARPAALPGAWLGVLLTGLAAGLALQVFLPAVAFLIVWPLALAGLGAAISRLGLRMDLPRTAALALLAALGGGWLATFFHGVAQGLDLPEILALFLWLGAFLVWPLATPGRFHRLALAPAAGLLLLGLALVGVIRFTDPWSVRHPQASTVLYVHDAVSGKARIVTTERAKAFVDLAPWTLRAMNTYGDEARQAPLPPISTRPVWTLPARDLPPGPAPVTSTAAGGTVTVALPAARVMVLDVRAGTPLKSLWINGKAVKVDAKAGNWIHMRLAGVPTPGQIVATPGGKGTFEVRYAVITEAWPAAAMPLPPRPAEAMPFDLSDSSVATGTAVAAY